MTKEKQPASVKNPVATSGGAKQAGEIRGRWSWVEPSAWNDRMLEALERGVKGGKWFSLMDKVYSQGNLSSAFRQVARNKGAAGVDHLTIADFEANLQSNLDELASQLREGTYKPQAIRRVWIPKFGSTEKRPLGIPTVRDRTVQSALRDVLEPIFERDFAEHSYGFRPGRGCKDALRRVETLLKQGYRYIVDIDFKNYFDTIPRNALLRRVAAKGSDGRVLALIELFLTQGIMDGLEEWEPDQGCPQGAVLSPLLSNVYLDPLDHRMAGLGFEMVRYADDIVVLCRSLDEAERALEEVAAWSASASLVLHPTKTRIVHVDREGFDFLGYNFRGHTRWPREKSLRKLKDTIRAKTKRGSGYALERIIADVNKTLRGWFEYFRHSNRIPFYDLDGWIRMRLRSILRHRMGKQGRSRWTDHQRWPNVFFRALGLFNLTEAKALRLQSSRR